MTPKKKQCCRCRRRKDKDEFYKNRRTSDGRQTYCKVCSRATNILRYKADPNIGKLAAAIYWSKPENIARRNKFRRALRYGLTMAELEALEKRANNLCEICKTPGRRLMIDHCHASGSVRGLVCGRCNIGLSFLDAGKSWFNAATRYLSL